jgi:polyisoprenoid-binding protein YceI
MKKLFLAALILASSLSIQSLWACDCGPKYQLDPEHSRIDFVTIKNGNVEVPGAFKKLSGYFEVTPYDNNPSRVDVSEGLVKIDITSLDTDLNARDKNILRYFFEISKNSRYKTASFTLKEPLTIHTKRKKQKKTLKGMFSLHGRKGILEIPVTIFKKGKAYQIKSRKPVTLEFSKWSFFKAVSKLMKVCGHDALKPSADINLDLLFIPDDA